MYFIIVKPFLTSFSTLKCISIAAINLIISIDIVSGALIPRCSVYHEYFQTANITANYKVSTVNVFMNVEAISSSSRSKLPLNSDFNDALKHIDTESGVNTISFESDYILNADLDNLCMVAFLVTNLIISSTLEPYIKLLDLLFS
jgi:hypothetical protein